MQPSEPMPADAMPPADAGAGGDDPRALFEQMAAEIPDSERPFPRAAVESVVEAFNELRAATYDKVAAASGQPVPPDMVVPPGDKFEKFPAEVYVPAALLLGEVAKLGKGMEKYRCDPEKLSSVAGARTLAGKMMMAAKDKKLLAAVDEVAAGMAGRVEEASKPPPTAEEDVAYLEERSTTPPPPAQPPAP